MATYKEQIEQASPEDIIINAAEQLGDLADELDTWYDGMSENLKQSDKANQIQDASATMQAIQSTLESINTEDEHFYPDAKISYTTQVKTRKAKQPSRQVRFDNIMNSLMALRSFYTTVDDEDDHNTIIDSLEEAIEEVEIPGAWG